MATARRLAQPARFGAADPEIVILSCSPIIAWSDALPTVAQSSGGQLKLSPGSGIQFDPVSGALSADPETLAAGVAFRLDSESADGAKRSFQITVTEIPQQAGTSTSFETAGALDRVSFLAAAPPGWTQQAGFARLTPATTSRAHGDWSGAGGNGLYRCLVRIGGGLPAAIDRRFSFGARVRLVNGNWNGIRVETFETMAGEKRLHIREYTGESGTTISLATTTVGWSYDAWHWLEIDVADAAVRARIYPEAAAAPDWQVSAVTRQLAAGAYGPGGFPSGGVAPVIDLRKLEFLAAV